MSHFTYTVTVVSSGGFKYVINGVQQANLNLFEGATYRFDQSDSSNSGHFLRFSTTSGGTHSSGSEYTTGVTTSGVPGNLGAYTQITVAASAPDLFYYCQYHSGMGGIATTAGTILSGWGRSTWNAGPWGEGTFAVSTSVTGVSASSVINSATVTAAQNVTVSATGVSATTDIGNQGWGRSTWSSGGWGAPIFGTVVEGTGVTVSETGVQGASTISNVSVSEGGGITVGISSGVQAAGVVNDIVIPQALIFVTGVQAASVMETVDVGLGHGVTGVQAAGSTGSESVIEGAGITVSATGVVAASATGNETIVEGAGITVTETGVSATSHIANVGIAGLVIVTGVSASSQVSTATMWSKIDTTQTPNWVEVDTTQTPNWVEIAA